VSRTVDRLVDRLVLGHGIGQSAFSGSGDDADEAPPLGSGKAAATLRSGRCRPTRASLASSCALNLVVKRMTRLVQGMPRHALDGDDDRLVHLVADDTADLGLPLALHCCSCIA